MHETPFASGYGIAETETDGEADALMLGLGVSVAVGGLQHHHPSLPLGTVQDSIVHCPSSPELNMNLNLLLNLQ